MDKVVVDPDIRAKLSGVGQTLELCDGDGRVLGYFAPAVD
jgi:hypothetical protein